MKKSSGIDSDSIKNPNDVNVSQKNANLSGLKSALHGTSYQLKLGIVVCLANAKKLMDPTKTFKFNITAEDPAAGKFDDIVYDFQDGETKGILKIQAKHKLGPNAYKITIDDFITTNDTKNPFAIMKYFTSFYDQEPLTTDLEGLIICTNAYVSASDVDKMWKNVQNADPIEETQRLDRYVSELFASVGGMCYQLDYEKLTDPKNTLYQRLVKCSKRTRLARLLVKATKSQKQEITLKNTLLEEYRIAIESLIDSTDTSTSGSYRFKKEFLDASFISSIIGYDDFRKEFEVYYRQEFQKIQSCNVWEELEQKRIYVAKSFLSPPSSASAATPSKSSFPDDDVKEYIKTFCDRFRLVCATDSKLDEPIVKLWDYWCYGDNQSIMPDTGIIEASMASENLFKRTFNWLEDPYAKPLDSDDIRNTLQTIDNDLAFLKLKGISSNRRMELVKSPFRILPDTLTESDLYDQMETDSFVELETYDIQFSATIISDILDGQGKDHYNTIFLEESDVIHNSKSVDSVFRSNEHAKYMIIVCREMFPTVKNIVKKWKRDILKSSDKQLVLISKSSNTCDELAQFRLNNLDESRSPFFAANYEISLYNTTISPAVLFKHVLDGQLVEEIIQQLDKGKQMEENNAIVNNYRSIENIYVQRVWMNDTINQNPNFKRSKTNREEMHKILASISDAQDKEIKFIELTNRIKKLSMFTRAYGSMNEQVKEASLFDKDRSKKVIILLGEAGCGKSTNITWLAWHMQKQNPSSWIIRCNLSDYCIDFKRFNEDPAGMIREDTKALKFLYELLYLSSIDLNGEPLQAKRLSAQKCAECISSSKRKVVLSRELMNENKLSLDNTMHLGIFQEKFNASKLLLFFDGFDEIAPHYKEVVLMLLSRFAQFNGVDKLFVTSRPHNFKEEFGLALKKPSYYQLKPLSMQDKGLILYKMLEVKLYKKHIRDVQISDLYKALCVTLLYSLGQMSDVALNLMTSVDILVGLAAQYINFSSASINVKLFEEIDIKFRSSFIVDEFVKTKIRKSLYEKIGADTSAEANPREIERFENAIYDAKLKHGLLGIWVLFDQNERETFLSQNELLDAQLYMRNIEEAKEKTGIIDRIQEEVPIFIHRTFAEYLAAWWIVERCIKCIHSAKRKVPCLHTLCNRKREFMINEMSELHKHVDTILAKNIPIHLAIVEGDMKIIKSLLFTNPNAFMERDAGGRTILHLLAYYTPFVESSKLLPAFIARDIVNAKDTVYGWTALDLAYQAENDKFSIYLMHQGASINASVIYEQVVSSRVDNVYRASMYTKYVMEYLSREAIEYELHDNYRIIKEFCYRAALFLTKEKSIDKRMSGYPYYRMNNRLLKLSEKDRKMLNVIVDCDSVWMLESMIQHVDEQVYSTDIIRNTIFEVAVDLNSIFVLKYCFENDASLISEKVLQKCLEKCIIQNYKNEFKWFFDCYCSRLGIQEHLPGSIHSDNDTNHIFHPPSNEHNMWRAIPRIERVISETASEIVMDINLLWILVLIVVSARPSILRYFIVSCQLNLDAGLIFYLARIIDNYYKEVEIYLIEFFIPYVHDENVAEMKQYMRLAFKTLLDQPSTLSDNEATEMLHLAIASDMFDFLEYLVEHDGINFQAVDAASGWTAFHLCVSRSTDQECNAKLFCSMFERTDIDCFGIFDLKGRSVLHLALENGHQHIVDFIMTRKLENINKHNIGQLGCDVLSNLMEYYYTIHEQSQAPRTDERYYRKILRKLAKQITKIALSAGEELSVQHARKRAILQKDADKLYQIAVECSSLFLMNYLHHEYGCTIDHPNNDEDWLACMAKCLETSNLQVFQWMIGQYKFCHRIANPIEHGIAEHISYDVIENCETDDWDWPAAKPFMYFFNKAEEKLSGCRSKEDVCIMRLVFFTVHLGQKSAARFLCTTLLFTFDWKFLLDIIEVAHQLKSKQYCIFESPTVEPIYGYLFQRITNLRECDATGRSLLHLAIELKLSCITMLLVERGLFQITTINNQNGWNVIHYYASQNARRIRCYTEDKDLVFLYLLNSLLENDKTMIRDVTERLHPRIVELCFNNTNERQCVIDVALMAGNVDIVNHIILLRLGIKDINHYTISNEIEHTNLKECYDMINKISALLPFNAKCEYLLHRLAKSIDNFSLGHIEQIVRQENVHDHVVGYAETAFKYRAVSTLEQLISFFNCEMCVLVDKIQFSERELIVLIIECIRRHRIGLFKMNVHRYCSIKGIKPSEVTYKEEENEEDDEYTIDEDEIAWSSVEQLPEDDPVDRNYLILLIMLAAYGRLSMTRYFVEMLQPYISAEWIILIMKALTNMKHSKTRAPVYEYLLSLEEDSDSEQSKQGIKW